MVKVPLRMRPVYLRSLVDKYNYLFANICSLPSDDRPKVETHPKRISYIVRLQSSKRKTIGCCTVDVLTYEIVVTNDDISERSILYKYQSPDWCEKIFTIILLTLSFTQKLVVVAPNAMKLALMEPSGATNLIGA